MLMLGEDASARGVGDTPDVVDSDVFVDADSEAVLWSGGCGSELSLWFMSLPRSSWQQTLLCQKRVLVVLPINGHLCAFRA